MVLVLLGAMRQEVEGVRKRLGLSHAVDRNGWRTSEGRYEGKDLVLVETGWGRRRAERAAAFVLEHYPVTAVVSFGFAGGLAEGSRPGDVILCRRLHDGAASGAGSAHQSDEGLIVLAGGVPIADSGRVVTGSSVTVDRVVAEPGHKEALGKAFGADVVDMEGYWLAEAASAAGVPFLAVRAISDPVSQLLPPFDRWLDARGRWQLRRAATHLLTHPSELATLPELYINVRRAERSLVRLIAGLVPRL